MTARTTAHAFADATSAIVSDRDINEVLAQLVDDCVLLLEHSPASDLTPTETAAAIVRNAASIE
ncbi:MAG: hypothetical protein H0T14_09045 [Nocardioidaceae bacterium]|nr:hypothetical protein [Nocardioidaceae bacterium]